jgi:hypothetical protein
MFNRVLEDRRHQELAESLDYELWPQYQPDPELVKEQQRVEEMLIEESQEKSRTKRRRNMGL